MLKNRPTRHASIERKKRAVRDALCSRVTFGYRERMVDAPAVALSAVKARKSSRRTRIAAKRAAERARNMAEPFLIAGKGAAA